MFYGLLLGGFWVVKYIFFILGTLLPAVDFISIVLTPVTLLLAYLFTKVYKIILGGKVSFSSAWSFGVLLFFFASLIEALPQYVFFSYIASPEYMAGLTEQATLLVEKMGLVMSMEDEVINQIANLSPIQLTFQGIFANVFYGIILSIPVAALLCRGAIPPEYMNSSK